MHIVLYSIVFTPQFHQTVFRADTCMTHVYVGRIECGASGWAGTSSEREKGERLYNLQLDAST